MWSTSRTYFIYDARSCLDLVHHLGHVLLCDAVSSVGKYIPPSARFSALGVTCLRRHSPPLPRFDGVQDTRPNSLLSLTPALRHVARFDATKNAPPPPPIAPMLLSWYCTSVHPAAEGGAVRDATATPRRHALDCEKEGRPHVRGAAGLHCRAEDGLGPREQHHRWPVSLCRL